jgi:hypothetical protein
VAEVRGRTSHARHVVLSQARTRARNEAHADADVTTVACVPCRGALK